MENNKITIHDIAKILNINSSTVSRALNNSSKVTQKTKDKIIAKANELGYQRNHLASNLRKSKTYTIGVIVPRISRHFFSRAIAGIEEAAYQEGYNVIICQSLESVDREKKIMDTLLSNRVDGVLISISMESVNQDHFKAFRTQGTPIVFFDRPCNISENTNVIIDDFKAGFDATEHLIDVGCQDIAHFSGPQNIELYVKRCNGYKAALVKHGIPIRNEYIIESHLMQEDGIRNAEKLRDLPTVDGVFSANDTAAISAMQYLKEKNVNVPSDIAFVGFSNEPISAVIEPSLTTVIQPDFEMGKEAVKLLINEIVNKVDKNQTKIFPSELVYRNSTKK